MGNGDGAREIMQGGPGREVLDQIGGPGYLVTHPSRTHGGLVEL